MRVSLLLSAIALMAAVCFAQPNTPAVLPQAFGGWKSIAPVQTSRDPAAADPVDAALLKEYGFTDFAGTTYVRDDGRKLTVKAARFQDASGAYGAFTFYKTPEMLNEKIGDANTRLESLLAQIPEE